MLQVLGKEKKMKKIIFILSGVMLGSVLLGTEASMDEYYNNIDTLCPVLSAHQKMNKPSKELMRKRAYRRKRMRRLPNNGK